MKEQFELKNNIPQTIEEATKVFIESHDINIAIQFLQKNPDETTEFCYKIFETYKENDKTGLILLSKIIKGLL